MKQGRVSTSNMGAIKREPIVHAIKPGYVAQLGTHVGVVRAVESMHEGRGFVAPKPIAVTTHHCGSQGKHR